MLSIVFFLSAKWEHKSLTAYFYCACLPPQSEIRQQLAEKAKSGELKAVNGSAASQAAAAKRKRRWDQTAEQGQTPTNTTPKKMSSWDQADEKAEVTETEPYQHLRPQIC